MIGFGLLVSKPHNLIMIRLYHKDEKDDSIKCETIILFLFILFLYHTLLILILLSLSLSVSLSL